MHIRNLQLREFGVFQDTSFNEFGDGLTVVFGRNETGKTTLMHFLRGMLYGFSATDRRRYLGLHNGVEGIESSGGQIDFTDANNRSCELKRTVNSSGAEEWEERITLTANGVSTSDPAAMEQVVGIVDDATFARIYAIGLAELQELNLLGNTEAAQLIYRLTSGLDRVSLFEILDEVNLARQKYLTADGRGGTLPDLYDRREAAQIRVAELESRSGHWARLVNRRKATEKKIKDVEDEARLLEIERRTVEVARRVYGEWQQRRLLNAQLASLAGQVPTAFAVFSDDPVKRLDHLESQLAGHRSEVEDLSAQRNALRTEADQLEINRPMVRQRARIDAIGELSAWIAQLQGQEATCQADINRMQDHLSRSYGIVPTESGAAAPGPAVTDSAITALRGPARQWRDQKQRLRDAQKSIEEADQQVEIAEQELQAALDDACCSDLAAELEGQAARSVLLRRREANEERLSHLRHNRDSMVGTLAEPATAELLTARAMICVGTGFVAGFMALVASLLLGGWLGLAPVTRAITALCGIGSLIGSLVSRYLVQRNNITRLAMQHRQLEFLTRQEEECTTEADRLDDELGPCDGNRDAERAESDARITVLEEIIPLEAGRRAARQRVESIAIRLEHAETAFRAAEVRWSAALAEAGLPETLLPRHLRQYASEQKHLQEQSRQLEQRQLDLKRCQMELDSLRRRIEQVYLDSGISPSSEDLSLMLRELSVSLASETRKLTSYRSLVKKDRGLRRRVARLEVLLEELETRRSSMFSQTGCATEIEFRSQAGIHGDYLVLKAQLVELDREIQSTIGNEVAWEDVEKVLVEAGDDDLADSVNAIGKDIQRVQQRRDELNQRTGCLENDIRALEEDTSLAAAQLELSELSSQCSVASQTWRSWEATRRVLAIVRDEYENERQPETLREASRWLRTMTGGRYSRVWTPMGEDTLLLDDEFEQVWALESLSSGTRETVYLSLRLALIEGYRKRGVVLPVVLDDVLVNFDAERTERAIAAISEFADLGHQVLFFTCHAHVNALFADMDIDSRELELRPAHPPRLQDPGGPNRGVAENVDLPMAEVAREDEATAPMIGVGPSMPDDRETERSTDIPTDTEDEDPGDDERQAA